MSDNEDKITKDIAIPMGLNERGNKVFARIQGTDEKPVRVMVGEVTPLQEGVPVMGEVVRLTPHDDHYHCETVIEDPYREQRGRAQAEGNHTRKSFGATQKMRDNWDRIFGKKPDPVEVN